MSIIIPEPYKVYMNLIELNPILSSNLDSPDSSSRSDIFHLTDYNNLSVQRIIPLNNSSKINNCGRVRYMVSNDISKTFNKRSLKPRPLKMQSYKKNTNFIDKIKAHMPELINLYSDKYNKYLQINKGNSCSIPPKEFLNTLLCTDFSINIIILNNISIPCHMINVSNNPIYRMIYKNLDIAKIATHIFRKELMYFILNTHKHLPVI